MALQPPPANLSQAYLEESNKDPVCVALAFGVVLSTTGVILRGVAKRRSVAEVGWDDYTIVIALVLLFGLHISTLLAVLKYGLGRHAAAISTLAPFRKIAIANITLWLATAAATKASLLLLYHRLFGIDKHFRVAVRICAVIIFCQWISLTVVAIFQCIPVAAFLNSAIQHAKCVDLVAFAIVSGVMNLLTDVLILCLPIRMIWGLHKDRAQKLSLTGIFLLGILVCVISIVRISKISAMNNDDATWGLVNVYVWTDLEDSVGILSACLPTLRPLFRRIFSGGSVKASSKKKELRSETQTGTSAPSTQILEGSNSEVPDLSVATEMQSLDSPK